MELLDCPFCGGVAVLQKDGDHHGGFFTLGCETSGCPGHNAFYTEAIEDLQPSVDAWNRRIPATRVEIRKDL